MTDIIFGALLILAFVVGLLLRAKSRTSYDGHIVVSTTEEGKKLFTLELDGDPHELEKRESVTFKIRSEGSVEETL